jgi:hypothetical protein
MLLDDRKPHNKTTITSTNNKTSKLFANLIPLPQCLRIYVCARSSHDETFKDFFMPYFSSAVLVLGHEKK